MTRTKHPTDPAASGRAYLEEGDIGSGEKTPAQKETEEMIREIPPLQPGGAREHDKQEDGGQSKQ